MAVSELRRVFTEKAVAVQCTVSIVKSIEEACQYTVDMTIERGGKTIAAPMFSAKDLEMIRSACEDAGINLFHENLRRHANQINTSLTLTNGAIAETGTLVINSADEDIRISTMLADTHVAILTEDKIFPDAGALHDDLDRLLKGKSPAYMAFITGPSRTADIERVLAIGVHGPKELHILIMEGKQS